MIPNKRSAKSAIAVRTRATTSTARRVLVYGLCFMMFASVTPLFAQRRTAIRVPSTEAKTSTPSATEKSEREKERESRGATPARVRTKTGALNRPLQEDEKGYMVGVPTTEAMGIQKTTAHIMSEQAYAPEKSTRPTLVPEREIEGRSTRPQNPKAKPVSSIPSLVPERSLGKTEKAAVMPSAPQTVSTNFNAVTGPTETGAFPPDTMGAIGPSQFILFVNGMLRTFNKATGTADSVINVDPDVFFAPVMTPVAAPVVINFTSDPMVRYDRLSGRWFLSIIDVPCTNATCTTTAANRWMLAVSDAASSSAITAGTVWTFYFFQTDAANFCDYPSLGVDSQALYTGCNMFTSAGSYVGTNGFVIRKTSVLGGGPLVQTTFANMALGVGAGPFAPRGVDNYDPLSNEGYFIGVDNATFSTLMLRRVSTPGATPAISPNIPLTVPTTASSIPIQHFGNTGGNNGRIDSLDDRLFAAHIRNGRLWTSHNIRVSAAGVGSTAAQSREAVRWYELNGVRSTDNGGVLTIVQSGTIFDTAATLAAARTYSIPSVMVSGQGHAAFGFTTAGAPFRIDAATNGRLAGDALGTTQAVALYTASSTAYNPPADPGGAGGRRWGDYSFTSLDPLDDMTMWTVQEYCNATNTYGARVAKLLAPPPATPSLAAPATVADEDPSENITITGTQVAGSGFYDPGADLAPPALPFNHISVSVTGGVTVNSVTYNSPTSLSINVSTVGATPGLQTVTVTNPDGQSLGGAILTVTPPVATSGQVLISEFRFHGSAGGNDEFVELYNNSNSPIVVSSSDGSAGWGLVGINTTGTTAVRFTVPNGTTIPARGHYLATNNGAAGYSLGAAATGDITYATGIVDGGGIALFTTATLANISSANRLDSVGFSGITGANAALFSEGTALLPAGGTTTDGEYSWVRKLITSLPQDTDSNNADFEFVSTNGAIYSTRQSVLGAPGPENLASPIQRNTTIKASLVDVLASSNAAPNRVRDANPYTDTLTASAPNGGIPASNPYPNGTLSIRRKFTNNTGAPVTRLRFRVVEVTTLPPSGGNADIRALSSSTIVVNLTGGGTATVQGLTLEQGSVQPFGGGLNSTLSAGTVTVGTPIAPGASMNFQFLLGVGTGGAYRFFINVEALP